MCSLNLNSSFLILRALWCSILFDKFSFFWEVIPSLIYFEVQLDYYFLVIFFSSYWTYKLLLESAQRRHAQNVGWQISSHPMFCYTLNTGASSKQWEQHFLNMYGTNKHKEACWAFLKRHLLNLMEFTERLPSARQDVAWHLLSQRAQSAAATLFPWLIRLSGKTLFALRGSALMAIWEPPLPGSETRFRVTLKSFCWVLLGRKLQKDSDYICLIHSWISST